MSLSFKIGNNLREIVKKKHGCVCEKSKFELIFFIF